MSDFDDYNSITQGMLYKDIITNGLSKISTTADGSKYVFTKLDLKGHGLTIIDELRDYEYLQILDLSCNQLQDVSILNLLTNLVDLNVSSNELSRLLDISPLPRNLRVVNYARNHLTAIPELQGLFSLTTLILDHNEISEINGLSNLMNLKTLSLCSNQITEICNLDNLPLTTLNISNNNIVNIDGLFAVTHLRFLNLANNKIRSLSGLRDNIFLEQINLKDNEIIDLKEIEYLCKLTLLRSLNLSENPVRELPDYRPSVVYRLYRLAQLDHTPIDTSEKVASKTLFNPSPEVVAARDHVMNVVYSFLQPSHVYESTLPSESTPYPMLILVGPNGMYKHELILKLVDEFPDYFGLGLSHTTRPKRSQDDDSYNFISYDQFEMDIKAGKFLQTYCDYEGNMFGMQKQTVENVASESLACIFQMTLEGVLSLKLTHFEPRYVLMIPSCSDVHERRLFASTLYSDLDIVDALRQSDRLSDYHREHPGFFDACISSDDVTDCYKALRRLVMDYLGLGNQMPTPHTPASSEFDRSSTSAYTYDKESTMDIATPCSRPLARSWSKSFINTDSSPPAEPPVNQLGHIELESNNRRKSNASKLVTGNLQTNDYITPITNSVAMRSFSAPNGSHDYNLLPSDSPDSSQMEQESELSNISEANHDIISQSTDRTI